VILLTGATGTVGRELVTLLLARDVPLRALVRDASRARLDPRVQLVEGDLLRADSLPRAVAGVQRVFSLAVGPTLGQQERALALAARAAGVRHIVKLSVLGAGGRAREGVAAWHDAGERAVQESGVPWTFLRPGAFQSNARFWRDTIRSERCVFSNFGDGKVPVIHPRDIAEVAALALTSDGHEGQAWPITGPVAISTGEQVRILGEALGQRLEYVAIGDEAARERMLRSGMPGDLIEALLPFASKVRAGRTTEVHPTVERLLGRPALGFEVWARENAEAFR
jgi:uncharacterized protein YbjT (DUF2867 family)